MNKKVLIISSSPRKGGNSETLAAAFAKGAREAGNQVETVSLREKQVGFCKGCLACLKLGHCVIQDDAVEIAAKMHDADVLVFATPVYYYSVSGQLKTMLDRANPLYDTDYAFTKAYLLATAAEDAPETFEGTEKAVQGWVDCFPRCTLAGTVFAGGVNDVGEIAGHPALEQAYRMGKEVWAEDDAADAKTKHANEMVFPIGAPNDGFAKYFVGQSYLAPLSTAQVGIYNVTFEPGCRNNWHIHHAKSGGGQMLVCTAGEGWYCEEGKEPVSLTPGTVIAIPANVRHWHGAKKDSWFSHIAFEIPGEDCSTEWCEPVGDEEYNKLK